MAIFKYILQYSRYISLQRRFLSDEVTKATAGTFVSTKVPISDPLFKTIERRLAMLTETLNLGGQTEVQQKIDALQESIVKSVDVDQIKHIIRNDFRRMQSYHVAQCFESLNNIIRYTNHSDMDKFKNDIISSDEFEVLTNRCLKMTNQMLPSESLTCLNTLSTLDFQYDTVLVQALLQMIRYQVNDLQMKELFILSHLLKRADSDKTPLINALWLAMPLVIKNCINNKQINFDSPHELLRTVHLIMKIGLDRFLDFDKDLTDILHFLARNMDRLSLKENVDLVNFLLQMDIDPSTESYLAMKKTMRRTFRRILKSEESEISQLSRKVLHKVQDDIDKNLSYYDPPLLALFKLVRIAFNNSTSSEEKL